MKSKAVILGLLLCYVSILIPFTSYMKSRPLLLKLGFAPSGKLVRAIAGDHRCLAAELYVVRVLFYFGELAGSDRARASVSPEYFNMFKTMENAVLLDPYNQDAYYFSQAAFTWELGRVREVNSMLKHGMKYRAWDYQLPFFIGFNSAYFLKDYATAATYMRKAAEISGNPLFITLAARYFYEAGETDFGIMFLDTMAKGTRDPKLKKVYKLRKDALRAVKLLSGAVARFRETCGRMPADLRELVAAGILKRIPDDPYGGVFYLDGEGKIRTTSKFAFKEQREVRHDESN